MTVLALDPGRAKVGYAVIGPDGGVRDAGIAPVNGLTTSLAAVLEAAAVEAIALGRGTNGRAVRAAVEPLGVPIYWVDEFETSRQARRLYFEANPPRGWRRFVPVGLQVPPRPVDDYAAVAIGRRFLQFGPRGTAAPPVS